MSLTNYAHYNATRQPHVAPEPETVEFEPTVEIEALTPQSIGKVVERTQGYEWMHEPTDAESRAADEWLRSYLANAPIDELEDTEDD